MSVLSKQNVYRTTRETRPDATSGVVVLTKITVDNYSASKKDTLTDIVDKDVEIQTKPTEVVTVNVGNFTEKAIIKNLSQNEETKSLVETNFPLKLQDKKIR